jgi:adenylate cyclase
LRLVERTLARVGLRILVANLVGASLAFFYLAVVSPFPPSITRAQRGHIIRVNLVVFAVFMTVMGIVIGLLMVRKIRNVDRWAHEERDPSPAEVDAVLHLPHTLLTLPGVTWLLAATTFGVVQPLLGLGWVIVLRVASGIVLGGLITSTLTYLLVERALRPLAAFVLTYGPLDRPRAPGILPRVVVSWLLSSALPLVAVGLSQLFRSDAERRHLAGPIWFLVLVGVVTGAIAMTIAAKSVAEPVSDVRTAQRDVQAGRLDVTVPVRDASEVGLLQAGFNEMVAGLRERSRLQDIFGRHVGAEVARQALERGIELGGETRDVSVLFADVIGSTTLAQQRPADELVRALNAFFGAVVASAREEGGWVNKFDGDGALCVFGAPADLPGHRAAALRAARRLRDRLAALPPETGIVAGVGVSSGLVTAGNVGAEERFEYTVIGDPVNEAARITEAAKTRPERVLASEPTVLGAGEEAAYWRRVAEVTLRGRAAPTALYAPAGGDQAAYPHGG